MRNGIKLAECGDSDEIMPKKAIHLSHPKECSKFYKCFYGRAFLMVCPDRQHWSVKLNRCEHPKKANCKPDGSYQTRAKAARVKAVGYVDEDEESEEITIEGHPLCAGDPDPYHPKHFGHADDCTRFYKCFVGTAYEKRCPRGQHWAEHLDRCEMPELARCRKRMRGKSGDLAHVQFGDRFPDSRCPDVDDAHHPVHFAIETDPTKFFLCFSGDVVVMQCPERQEFDLAKRRCEYITRKQPPSFTATSSVEPPAESSTSTLTTTTTSTTLPSTTTSAEEETAQETTRSPEMQRASSSRGPMRPTRFPFPTTTSRDLFEAQAQPWPIPKRLARHAYNKATPKSDSEEDAKPNRPVMLNEIPFESHEERPKPNRNVVMLNQIPFESQEEYEYFEQARDIVDAPLMPQLDPNDFFHEEGTPLPTPHAGLFGETLPTVPSLLDRPNIGLQFPTGPELVLPTLHDPFISHPEAPQATFYHRANDLMPQFPAIPNNQPWMQLSVQQWPQVPQVPQRDPANPQNPPQYPSVPVYPMAVNPQFPEQIAGPFQNFPGAGGFPEPPNVIATSSVAPPNHVQFPNFPPVPGVEATAPPNGPQLPNFPTMSSVGSSVPPSGPQFPNFPSGPGGGNSGPPSGPNFPPQPSAGPPSGPQFPSFPSGPGNGPPSAPNFPPQPTSGAPSGPQFPNFPPQGGSEPSAPQFPSFPPNTNPAATQPPISSNAPSLPQFPSFPPAPGLAQTTAPPQFPIAPPSATFTDSPQPPAPENVPQLNPVITSFPVIMVPGKPDESYSPSAQESAPQILQVLDVADSEEETVYARLAQTTQQPQTEAPTTTRATTTTTRVTTTTTRRTTTTTPVPAFQAWLNLHPAADLALIKSAQLLLQQMPDNTAPDHHFVFENGQVNENCRLTDDPMHPTHLPHPHDCQKFLKCLNGRAFEMMCPIGQEWNQDNEACDYPIFGRFYRKITLKDRAPKDYFCLA